MSQQRRVPWHKIDKDIESLQTDVEHEILVQREAIPIVFVPGIMGSRLQRGGGFRFSEWALPKKRWDPSSKTWMALNYLGTSGGYRKRMLIGANFSSDYLEVIKEKDRSNGFEGIMSDYCEFLDELKSRDWGPIAKIFELPVYAFGFNWTGRVEDAGDKLKERIDEIITEAKQVTGLCEKVILVTHSMGGLVARWASEGGAAPARDKILGIIHGVQPVTGAPAAYWRMKAGFEGDTGPALVLGFSGRDVTPVLGNMPGGLSLLPNQLYRTNEGRAQWLIVTEDGRREPVLALPRADPYQEIYRTRAVVEPTDDDPPGGNEYWGLVDPDLLDPANAAAGSRNRSTSTNDINAIDARTEADPWDLYLDVLQLAESFHRSLGDKHHDVTFCSQGRDHPTADVVELRAEPRPWHAIRNYLTQGFRGFFRNANRRMQAVLQNPSGNGDGTVPFSSSGTLNSFTTLPPRSRDDAVEHQPAYEQQSIQDFTIEAILALCWKRYRDKHG